MAIIRYLLVTSTETFIKLQVVCAGAHARVQPKVQPIYGRTPDRAYAVVTSTRNVHPSNAQSIFYLPKPDLKTIFSSRFHCTIKLAGLLIKLDIYMTVVHVPLFVRYMTCHICLDSATMQRSINTNLE